MIRAGRPDCDDHDPVRRALVPDANNDASKRLPAAGDKSIRPLAPLRLLLPSGADAACILAEAYGPALPAFIDDM